MKTFKQFRWFISPQSRGFALIVTISLIGLKARVNLGNHSPTSDLAGSSTALGGAYHPEFITT